MESPLSGGSLYVTARAALGYQRPRARREERRQVVLEQVADTLDADVGRWVGGERLRVTRVVPLPRQHGGDATRPHLLHCRQDPQLVVDQHVMVGRVALLDVVELAFLVYIDQDVPVHGLVQPRALELARLEDRVAVGQDDRGSPGTETLQHIERVRIEAVRKG